VTLTNPASRALGPTQRSARGPRWVGVGLLIGCLLLSGCQGGGGEAPAEAPSTRPVEQERVEVGWPVSITIPAAGVDARVVPSKGPAVFHRLGELRRGDRIEVGQQGGGGRSFVVERVERRPKEALPTERIWNPTREPVLRLITCGGSFDRSTGHYRDNLIVFARKAP
jgi:hypothetical protein